ncbi:hypothetical protein KI387_024892 [Taxus chinensis]|uniref:PGG domain-containing protein n=1 Tax=Taxus chinensis TaxID=29808 RepID=A0AA38LC63_TAXCH|nr:hypothetical protein KI387_024892 [Taxus chinensis]
MDNAAHLCKGMDTRLYQAAESGNVKALNDLLDGCNLDVLHQVTPRGNTALHIAAYNGRFEFVKKLLEINQEDCEQGKEFLKAKNREGNTALHQGAMRGNDEVVKVLAEQTGCDLAHVTNGKGETALFKAAEEGHAHIVEVLSPLTPSQFDGRSSDDQTPLHRAVSKVHSDVIEKLLDKRPELVKQTDNCMRTALHMAALIPVIRPVSQFPLSVFEKDAHRKVHPIAKMLLEKDSSLCYRVDKNEQSALHLAAKVGNAWVVEEILKCGNDCIEMVDKDERNALHLVVRNALEIFSRAPNQLRLIISWFARTSLINGVDCHGQTPLDVTFDCENDDQVLFLAIRDYLLKSGADGKMLEAETILTRPTLVAKSMWKIETISENAVLIATVTFAAAFTLPGSLDSHTSTPALINVSLFKAFVIFDTLAFCSSIASAVLLIFALTEDPLLTYMSLGSLRVALISLAFTFGAAIHLVVAPECPWLALLVWSIVSISLIFTRGYSFHVKALTFLPRYKHLPYIIGELVLFPYYLGVALKYSTLDILYRGIIIPSLPWARKTIRRCFSLGKEDDISKKR